MTISLTKEDQAKLNLNNSLAKFKVVKDFLLTMPWTSAPLDLL